MEQQNVIVTPENVESVIAQAGQPGGLTLEGLMNLSEEELDVMWNSLMGEF